jgi:radical SAM superfamily enzyme YgiQ (UPF0313 family)
LLQGPPPADPFPQLVGITVHLTFARRAYELADWYRERGARVILGGLHVLSCPAEAASHADALAIGEGVQLWPEILRDVERGSLKEAYRGSYRHPYRDDPKPRRGILPSHSFLTSASLIATRGCHNRCDFCYLSTENLHMPYMLRDVEQMVEEFREQNEPYAVFIDNNLGSRPEFLRKLCRALAPLEKIWSAAVTLDVTDDPSLVREMALSGCTGVFIGFESLEDQNLSDARKRTPKTEDYARRVDVLHQNGIQVNGSFVFGFDHDSSDVFQKTVDWIEQNHLECSTFHILTPYPGTPLFARFQKENRLLHQNWELYDTAHVVFRPLNMTGKELAEGYAWCYERLFSHSSIWKRRPPVFWNVPAYLAGSYLYKKSNRLWPLLIRNNWTGRIWRPLVEISRRKHLRFRKKLTASGFPLSPRHVITAGIG